MASPYTPTFPDGTAYPTIPAGTSTVNVSTSAQLTSALSAATAGQRILLANATYSGSFTISGKNGTASSGISIQAATPGGAVFASGSTFTVDDCAYVTVNGLGFTFDTEGDTFQFRGATHHSRITRCTFGPATHTPSDLVSTMIYVGDDAFHIRIDHNEIRNKGTSGNGVRVYGNFDTFAGCEYVRIDHNIFRSIKPEVGNDKEPVRYGVSTMSRTVANGVIERNFFTDCVCEPEIISVKMGSIRVTGNTLLRCAGGPVIRHGTGSRMSDNYVVDRANTFGTTIGSGGIRFYDANHTVSYNYVDGVFGGNFQAPLLLDSGDAENPGDGLDQHWRVKNALVERNVIIDCPEGIGVGDNYDDPPTDCIVRDNSVAQVDTGTAVTQRTAPVNTTFSNNTYASTPAGGGFTQDADGIWRRTAFGPRLTYLVQTDVGPAGDLDDSDGTGALVEDDGGGPGGPPADTTTAAGRYGWGQPLADSDEFNYVGSPLSGKWSLYSGEGHDGNGRRRPERCNVDGSKLVITGLANGDSGGMAHHFDQQYGRWEVRCRSYNTSSSGAEYSPVLIIWPESDRWPEDGEYDFHEPGSPGALDAGAFIHFPHDADAAVQQRHFTKADVDLTQFHNFAIEWTADYIRSYIDGDLWYETSGGATDIRRDIQDMPSGHLTVQLDNFNGSSGNREAAFEIEWVRIYTLVPVDPDPGEEPPDPQPQNIAALSIESDERFGRPLVAVAPPPGVTPTLLGIDTILGENFYLGYQLGPVDQNVTTVGINSAEAFGNPAVTVDPMPVDQDVSPVGIRSGERFGAPVVTVGGAPPGLSITDLTISIYAIDPDGGPAQPLPDFESITLSPERNNQGSISVDYPREGHNFAVLRDAILSDRDIEIEIWTTGNPTGALRGYLQEVSGDPIDEDAPSWTFGGGFLELRMSEALVEPQPLGPLIPENGPQRQAAQAILDRMDSGDPINEDWSWDGAPSEVGQYNDELLADWEESGEPDAKAWLSQYIADTVDDDPSNDEHANEKRELVFASATPGEVMAFCMTQAQARGTLTDLTWDFTATEDSDGNTWPDVISTRFSPHVTYASILDRLVDLGLAEWAVQWSGSHRVLRMWVPEGRGEDRTLQDPPIVLRYGQNLLDAPHKWSVRDAGTTVFVSGADGLYDTAADASALARRGRRIERAASANQLNTPEAVAAFAQKQLEVTTTSLLEVTHGIGFLPGQPRPLSEYDVGDWVFSAVGAEMVRYRVVQWTLTVDDNQRMSGTVTLNDTVTESIVKLQNRIDAMQAGETVIGTSSGAFQDDASVPEAPIGVVVGSTAYLVPVATEGVEPGVVPAATAHAAVTISWLPVTLNTDGTAASDLAGYKTQYAYAAQPEMWIGVEDVGPNRTSTTFDADVGVNLMCRVAAYDRNGNVSDWSLPVSHTTEDDTTPPHAPSTPVVTDYLGTIRVFWDGLTIDGVDMMAASPDFSNVQIHVSTTSNFVPNTTTQVGQLRAYGTYSIIDMPYDTEQFVRLVAVDQRGNVSSPSAQGSATPTKLVNIDIGPNAIARAQIIDGEIVNAKIANLAVNDAKIMNVSVGKLTAGFVSADMILSTGEIRAGDNPNTYGVFDAAGIRFYRSNVETVNLNGTTGDALITGTYRSGLSGERIHLLPDGTFQMYGNSGTDYAEIANDGGIVRMKSRADSAGRRSWIDFDPEGFRATYGLVGGQQRSRFDAGITYCVLNAPVTGVRVWSHLTPADGTQNRFHFVIADATGDIEKSVLHYRLNPFKVGGVMIQAPGTGDDGSSVHWDNNAVGMCKGDGNAYVYCDAAEFRPLSTELAKRDIGQIHHASGLTSLDIVDRVNAYQWRYDWGKAEPRAVPLERLQPDGSMATEIIGMGPRTEPEPLHIFPIAEHLAVVAPTLVSRNAQGELMVNLRDSVGVLWDAVQKLSRQVRELRGQPDGPVIVEGQVLDPSRWAELPEGSNTNGDRPHSGD